MGDIFAAAGNKPAQEVALAKTEPPSSEALRHAIDEVLAEIPGLLDTTIGEYFVDQSLPKKVQEIVERFRDVTIHELMARAMRFPWEPSVEFNDGINYLAMAKRKPMNHLATIFGLYLFFRAEPHS